MAGVYGGCWVKVSEKNNWLDGAIRSGSASANHHWWPVALQSYWGDSNGKIATLSPSGDVKLRNYKNKKIGQKRHAHTMHKGMEDWEHKYEGFFDAADNQIHDVVSDLRLKYSIPKESIISRSLNSVKNLVSKPNMFEVIRTCSLPSGFENKLILMLISLLLRSPSYRSKLTLPLRLPDGNTVPIIPNEGGDLNHYFRSLNWLTPGAINSQFVYVFFLWSPKAQFIFGDGLAQSILSSNSPNSPSGDCIIPLLPDLCVYLSTSNSVRSKRKAAMLRVGPDAVALVNRLTQIYSSKEVFYSSAKPELSEHFVKGQHLVVDYKASLLFQLLNSVVEQMQSGFEP
jgi:hypothetical protein